MAETEFKVAERYEKPAKTRKSGMTPGIIYGEGIDGAIAIKFDMPLLAKLLKNQLKNAKLQIKLGGLSRLCLVKEFQRDAVSGRIIHVDFQAVSENEIVRLHVPIVFEGVPALESKRHILIANVSELELEGKVSMLPEHIIVDVSHRKVGEKIHLRDLALDSSIKTHFDVNEAIAVIAAPKENAPEAGEPAKTAEGA